MVFVIVVILSCFHILLSWRLSQSKFIEEYPFRTIFILTLPYIYEFSMGPLGMGDPRFPLWVGATIGVLTLYFGGKSDDI